MNETFCPFNVPSHVCNENCPLFRADTCELQNLDLASITDSLNSIAFNLNDLDKLDKIANAIIDSRCR